MALLIIPPDSRAWLQDQVFCRGHRHVDVDDLITKAAFEQIQMSVVWSGGSPPRRADLRLELVPVAEALEAIRLAGITRARPGPIAGPRLH